MNIYIRVCVYVKKENATCVNEAITNYHLVFTIVEEDRSEWFLFLYRFYLCIIMESSLYSPSIILEVYEYYIYAYIFNMHIYIYIFILAKSI